jgi:hypothetical protein
MVNSWRIRQYSTYWMFYVWQLWDCFLLQINLCQQVHFRFKRRQQKFATMLPPPNPVDAAGKLLWKNVLPHLMTFSENNNILDVPWKTKSNPTPRIGNTKSLRSICSYTFSQWLQRGTVVAAFNLIQIEETVKRNFWIRFVYINQLFLVPIDMPKTVSNSAIYSWS